MAWYLVKPMDTFTFIFALVLVIFT